MLQQRHALLEDSIRLFGFYRECDDFEKWIKDKERMLRADDSTDDVEAAKCKFEVRFEGTCLVHLVYVKCHVWGRAEWDVQLWTVNMLT
jgi:hypothetical protein